jgi:hypothetical protein
MRRAFTDIVKAGEIGLVIMLLGSTWHEAPGLQIACYGPKQSVCDDYVARLKLKLSVLEPVATEGMIDYNVRPLIGFASEELAVPIMVIKMHKRYRMPRLQPELYLQLIGLINEFVSETGVELIRSRG